MSYQQGINQYIPNYVVKSDFLPTRVVEGNNQQTSELVHSILTIAPKIRRGKKKRKSFYPKTC